MNRRATDNSNPAHPAAPQTTNALATRVYESRADVDELRVLVDRLWPRGLSKSRADVDHWSRNVAPSSELRSWYGHDPERFDEFARRYRAELEEPEKAEALRELVERAHDRHLVLLTAAKEPSISHAAVLVELVHRRRDGARE